MKNTRYCCKFYRAFLSLIFFLPREEGLMHALFGSVGSVGLVGGEGGSQ